LELDDKYERKIIMIDINVKIQKDTSLVEFLQDYGFDVEEVDGSVLRVVREGELPVFVNPTENGIYFEVILCDLNNIKVNEDLLFKLLDINTEILPVSVGIDTSDPEAPQLVLVESREACNLNDNELLSVFDALEIAVDRVEEVLQLNI
jgi:uncharacterized protein YjfI (DUF2170 family)